MEGLDQLVSLALREDLGDGDVTTEATVGESATARGLITQKQPGVIYGLEAAETAFRLLDPDVVCERRVAEGVWREEGGKWRFLAWQSCKNPPPAAPAAAK